MRLNQKRTLINKVSSIGSKFSNITSIMLVGSASRDELRVVDDKVVSDFEFVFFVKRCFKDKKKVNDIVHVLADEFDVQIDICFVIGNKKMRFPKRLFYYDLVASGKVIFGEDYLINRIPFEASDLDSKDVSNIIFYRTLDILANSPLGTISPERLSINMSYVYFYMLINEGILEKDFRSRFARIEALAKSEIKFHNPLSELLFKKLEADYYFVRSVRMDANKSNPDNHVLKSMLDKIIKVIDHAIDMESFTFKHNLIYILRYTKASITNMNLLFNINILLSINPRKKLLKKIKKEFIERKKMSDMKNIYLEPLLLKDLYERNIL